METGIVREIVVHMLGFVAFFWVLKKLAFKPIGKVLDERRSRIEGGLREADETRRAAENLKAEYEKRLEGIEAEGRRKVQEAFSEGRRLAVEIQERGRIQAKGIVDKARQNVELEVEKARIVLRNEMAQVAVDMAERAIRTKLSPKDHERIVTDFIKEVKARQ